MKNTLIATVAIILVALITPVVFYICLSVWGDWHDEWSGYNASTYIGDGYCNIAVLPVWGEIHSYGIQYDNLGNELVSTNIQNSVAYLEQAEAEPGILGVMALIDSRGGAAAAATEIANALKKSKMPNAAYILDSGTSAGYLIATGADTIIASPFSDVGSIGVTMSYLDYSKQNADQGIEYISLASGQFKDYGNPDKPLLEEERTLLERDLLVWHDEFVRQVAENRNLSVEYVASLADGSSLPGRLALDAKLVDSIGDKEIVRAWFAEQLNVTPEEIVFCDS